MRTLRDELRLPRAIERIPDEIAQAVYLPRRSTRVIYQLFAVVVGISGGVIYARYFLGRTSTLWLVAVAAIGAVLGYILLLMPAALFHHTRRFWYRLAIARRRAAFSEALARTRRRLERAANDDPQDPEVWNSLGVAAQLMGDHEQAVESLEKACAQAETPDACKLNLAVALAEADEWDRAASLLAEAAELPQYAEAAQHNISVFLSRNPPQSVAQQIIGSVDGAASPAALNGLGLYELDKGDLDEAARFFASAAELDESAVAAHANLGVVAYRRDDIAAALDQTREATQLDPAFPGLVSNLGALLCAGGRPGLAAKTLSRAAYLAPGSAAVQLNRGCVRLVLGQYEDALNTFLAQDVRRSYAIAARHNAALALTGLDRYERASTELEQALEQAPENPDLHTNLGALAWAQGQEARMIQEFERAGGPAAEHLPSALNLATALVSEGRADRAVELLEKLPEQLQGDPVTKLYQGIAYLAQALSQYREQMSKRERDRFYTDLHLCVRPLQAARDRAPELANEANANLALYHYLRRDYDEATDILLDVAKEYRQDGFLQFAIGTIMVEQALQLQEHHEEEGLAGAAADLLRRARKHLQLAVERDETSSDVYCNLGMCAYNLGDLEQARKAFWRMMQIEESVEAANNLAIAYAQQSQRLRQEVKAVSLASEASRKEKQRQAQQAIGTALRYFSEALRRRSEDAVLHGNVGLAYMLRNEEGDVENALSHWETMLSLGGAEQRERYRQLTQMVHAREVASASFDETIMTFRHLKPRQCLTGLPPQLAGPHYAVQTVAEQTEWQFAEYDEAIGSALQIRDQINELERHLARLSV